MMRKPLIYMQNHCFYMGYGLTLSMKTKPMRLTFITAALFLSLSFVAQAQEVQTYQLPVFAQTIVYRTAPSIIDFYPAPFFSQHITGGVITKIDTNTHFALQTSDGSTPFVFSKTPLHQLDYNVTSMAVSHDIGKFTGFVAVDALTTQPRFGKGNSFVSPFEANTNLQNPNLNAQTNANVTAGFRYEVTSDFKIGAGVSVGNNRRFIGQ